MNGRRIEGLYSRKGLWLLALLALRQDRDVDRSWLAATLWPDADEPLGLYYLRRELAGLRKALEGESWRLTSPSAKSIRLDLCGASCDVASFDQLSEQSNERDLAHAVQVCSGPLLEGCTEEWVVPERSVRENRLLDVLEALADRAMDRAEASEAIRKLREVIARAPLRESAQRRLILALTQDGDLPAALQVYRELRIHLFRELNAEPDLETQALVKRLRHEARQRAAQDAQASSSAGVIAPLELPESMTSMVGRSEELRSLDDLLAHSRIVTLTGPGGIGKTRLALRAAEEARDRFADGAAFVDLAPIQDESLILRTICGALQVRVSSDQEPSAALAAALRTRQVLILLDNCEHLIASAGEAAHRLVQACRGVKLVATSREPLGLPGEAVYRVAPLDVPPSSDSGVLRGEDLSEYGSVALFVQRAWQANPYFRLGPENRDAVARICRRLDGIPLAIELAAARCRAVTPNELEALLGESFDILAGGGSITPPRHKTMRAAIAWSLDPLEGPERQLLEALTVFVGGCSLEDVEAVCLEPGEGKRSALDRLSALVDKSLVIHAARGDASWYRLLETVRDQAGEGLADDRREHLFRRHAEHYLSLLEQYSLEAEQVAFAAWGRRFDLEIDNLRAALGFLIARKEAAPALQLATRLQRYWADRGNQVEGREWLERVLALEGGDEALRAGALRTLGLLIFDLKEFDAARRAYEESLEIYERIGESQQAASAANSIGGCAHESGRYDEARVWYERALAANGALGLDLCVGMNHGNLGNVAADLGEFDKAMGHYEEGLALMKKTGSERIIPGFFGEIGRTLRMMGEWERAEAALREGLALARMQGAVYWQPVLLDNLGAVMTARGDAEDAMIYHSQSLALLKRSGDSRAGAFSLESMAKALHRLDRCEEGVKLVSAAGALRRLIRAPVPPSATADYNRFLEDLRKGLGPAAFASAEGEGMSLTFAEAISLALSSAQEPPASGAAKSIRAR